MTTDQKYRKVGRPSRIKMENVTANCSWSKTRDKISISISLWADVGDGSVFSIKMEPSEAERLGNILLEYANKT